MTITGTVYKDYALGVRIDDETSYATGGVESDADSLGKVTSINATWTDNTGRHLGIGEGRNETSHTYGGVDITGTVEWIMLSDIDDGPGGSISFMKYVIGKAQGSGSTAAPYELVECDAVDYSTMFSFALWAQNEAGTTDDVDKYEGCVGTSLTLSFAVDDVLKASMDFVAQKVTCATSITTAYVTLTPNPWVFQQGTFKWGQTPTAVEGVVSGTITVNNSPLIYRSFGSRLIEKPELGRRLYDFTLTTKMTSVIATAIRDDLLGQANSFIAGIDPCVREADNEIALEFAEGAASGDKKMTIELDDCSITSMSKPIPVGQGIVEVTFSGIAKSSKLDGSDYVFARYETLT